VLVDREGKILDDKVYIHSEQDIINLLEKEKK
jgi:hypothetical protein